MSSSNPVFFVSGSSILVKKQEDAVVLDRLPAGNYAVKFNPNTNQFYLDKADAFSAPSKMYGDVRQRATRIINTYLERGKNTGVLLDGKKGSGKTMLAREICMQAAASEHAVPTLLLSTPFTGDTFYQFLASITQPCIVFIDEAEKVFDSDDQEKLLTLLDGVFPTNKLFLMTCNDVYRIDSHIRNRPGRAHYRLTFKGLEQDFIREYGLDRLNDKSMLTDLLTTLSRFREVNFDCLQALVEESNRYKELPSDSIKWLNLDSSEGGSSAWEISAIFNGVAVPCGNVRNELDDEEFFPETGQARPKAKKANFASMPRSLAYPMDPLAEAAQFKFTSVEGQWVLQQVRSIHMDHVGTSEWFLNTHDSSSQKTVYLDPSEVANIAEYGSLVQYQEKEGFRVSMRRKNFNGGAY